MARPARTHLPLPLDWAATIVRFVIRVALEGRRATSPMCLAVLVSAASPAVPALAQQPEPTTPAATVWQLAPVSRVTPTGPGRLKKDPGTLVSDVQRQQLAVVTERAGELPIPFQRIDALHYEEDSRRVLFWRHSSFYLVVHFTDMDGQPAAEAMRLSSKSDALAALDRLELDTGLKVDRSLATHSFRGIPIRAVAGSNVVVTDWTGGTIEGTLTRLSASSVTIADRAGQSRTLGEASVRTMRLQYSPKRDALTGLVTGAALGAVASGLIVAAGGGDGAEVAGAAALGGAALGGIAAVVSMTTGAAHYPVNQEFDVYRHEPSRPPGVVITPRFAGACRGVYVSIAF